MTLSGFAMWLEWIFYAHWPVLMLCSIGNILVLYYYLHLLEAKEVFPWTVCGWVFCCYIEYGYGVG